jgi:hypothetical protein
VLAPENNTDRTLLNELVLDRQMKIVKKPVLKALPTVIGDNVAKLSVCQQVRLTPLLLELNKFNVRTGVVVFAWRKVGGSYLLLVGGGTYQVFTVKNINDGVHFNYDRNDKSVTISYEKEGGQKLFFSDAERRVSTLSELDALLK